MNVLFRFGLIALLMFCTSLVDAQLGGLIQQLRGGVQDTMSAGNAVQENSRVPEIMSFVTGTYGLLYVFTPAAEQPDAIELFTRRSNNWNTGNAGGLPTSENERVCGVRGVL